MKKISLLISILLTGIMGQASSIDGGRDDFSRSSANSQAYWYSRYNVGHLVMKSGMGEIFKPQKEVMKHVFPMVNGAISTATPPQNPALLRRVYNSGQPKYKNPSNNIATDFNNYRWASTDNSATTYSSFGWALVKEVEWSKQFNVDFHFGVPGDQETIPGAQQRFSGVMLCQATYYQAEEFLNKPQNFVSHSAYDNYVAVLALSNLSGYFNTKSTPLMSHNRCHEVVQILTNQKRDEFIERLNEKAYELIINSPSIDSYKEHAIALQSLVWYLSLDTPQKSEVMQIFNNLSWSLYSKRARTIEEKAYGVRALIESYRVTKLNVFLNKAIEHYQALVADYNFSKGFFNSKTTYHVDDVAAILGALNSLTHFAGAQVDQNQLSVVLTGFFEGTVNLSGLQISAPPVHMIPEYERGGDMNHRYPTLPVPPKVGSEYGYAPVYAESVTYSHDTYSWSANKDHFDTAGAMHLANEMMWFHKFEVNGFPEVN